MRRLTIFLLLALCACGRPAYEAVFTPFVYTDGGSETVPEGCYANPILKGFYPDPSICRKGNDYYMVTSTFQYFPVIPVFHSTDLIHWEQCGSVLDSDEQISFTRKKMNLGNFAPGISYNPADGKFYVACTQVGGGLGNWYCTSEDPSSGRWDGPFVIRGVRGIDPEFFFDEDGRAWYLTCTQPEDAGSHRTYSCEFAIVMWEFDCAHREISSGPRIIARGGAHPEDHPDNLEGPHLFKVDGKYFLICAEGGTERFHREVAFSSPSLDKIFEPCAHNPILTQKDLLAGRPDIVTCTGHADMVQTQGGRWYSVFLGCEPYEGEEYFNTGRETFLLPVDWTSGQPVILADGLGVPLRVEMDEEMKAAAAANVIPAFDAANPGPLWGRGGLAPFAMTVRGSLEGRCKFDKKENLHLECSGISLDSLDRPSMVLQRIASKCFRAETIMNFNPAERQEAGILCWYDDDHYAKFVKRLDRRGRTVLVLMHRSTPPNSEFVGYKTERFESKIMQASSVVLEGKDASRPLALRIEAIVPQEYIFSYAVVKNGEPGQFIPVGSPVDARTLSTRHCAGHQGTMVGVYAY